MNEDVWTAFWTLVFIGLVTLVVWACIADGQEMDRQHTEFSKACADAGRKAYDCDMQWNTYAEAHAAKQMAASAAAAAAGSASR